MAIVLGSAVLGWLLWGLAEYRTSLPNLRVSVIEQSFDTEADGLDAVAESIDSVLESLASIRAWSTPLRSTAPLWSWVPSWGGDLRQLNSTLEYAEAMLDSLVKSLCRPN